MQRMRVLKHRDYAFEMLRAKGAVVMPVESILTPIG